jgi:toxin HigB-1
LGRCSTITRNCAGITSSRSEVSPLSGKEFSGFARQAEVRLDRLEAAGSLKDLAALRGNRLEALQGDRQGQYSIRINDQWRICFEWPKESPGPINVEITDYH